MWFEDVRWNIVIIVKKKKAIFLKKNKKKQITMMDYLFGPLSKEYCLFFKIWAVISFLFAVFFFLLFLMSVIGQKKYSVSSTSLLAHSIQLGFQYFVARLFYSSCVK